MIHCLVNILFPGSLDWVKITMISNDGRLGETNAKNQTVEVLLITSLVGVCSLRIDHQLRGGLVRSNILYVSSHVEVNQFVQENPDIPRISNNCR